MEDITNANIQSSENQNPTRKLGGLRLTRSHRYERVLNISDMINSNMF
jgi:hypothetical protein